MDRLIEKLNEIKKEKNYEKRLKRLEEICVDENILNDALEIAKHNSTLIQPGASLITATVAVVLNFLPDTFSRFVILIMWMSIVWYLVKFEFEKWNIIYLDLIELRRMKRGKIGEIKEMGIDY